MSDQPLVPYDSGDPATIERQIGEAQAAGIDAFVGSWQGTGSTSDQHFPQVLDTAAAHNFQVALYFETNFAARRGVAAELRSALDHYLSHAAYLRWRGKPVIFFWQPGAFGNAAAWSQLRQQIDPQHTQIWSVDTVDASYLDVFDGIHLFSAGKWTGTTDVGPVDASWRKTITDYNTAHGTARVWAAGVIPGWDESHILPARPNAKVFPRRDGALYTESWQGAMASNPEWITITSYNEWFEGTQIEPSATYGSRYLDLTRQLVTSWKGGPPTAVPATPLPVTATPTLPPTPGGGDPCIGGTAFPQTGHSICKQMESYWRQYGGLAQFGYPINDAGVETDLATGKSYTVQYFQRARFELHPENAGTPYAVLLGRLGVEFHPPDPAVAALNDGQHHFFRETGHNVSALFYAYWQQHGGLFVNGFPISEEYSEVSATDGQTYQVQYFERERYEAHPENSSPYNVLLGLLGKQALDGRTGP
ncbi:MAG TPA: endo-1,3-alpha-glucanase family glycosylhydrolase [Chloroflexia bacterium]|nr:endo-1,3-alpha-glucanase family glycosylhydrolase [Chloroflexia bacterium]